MAVVVVVLVLVGVRLGSVELEDSECGRACLVEKSVLGVVVVEGVNVGGVGIVLHAAGTPASVEGGATVRPFLAASAASWGVNGGVCRVWYIRQPS